MSCCEAGVLPSVIVAPGLLTVETRYFEATTTILMNLIGESSSVYSPMQDSRGILRFWMNDRYYFLSKAGTVMERTGYLPEIIAVLHSICFTGVTQPTFDPKDPPAEIVLAMAAKELLSEIYKNVAFAILRESNTPPPQKVFARDWYKKSKTQNDTASD